MDKRRLVASTPKHYKISLYVTETYRGTHDLKKDYIALILNVSIYRWIVFLDGPHFIVYFGIIIL